MLLHNFADVVKTHEKLSASPVSSAAKAKYASQSFIVHNLIFLINNNLKFSSMPGAHNCLKFCAIG